MAESGVKIHIDSSEIDIALEKAQRLTELLGEAQTIIRSLSGSYIHCVDTFINNRGRSVERMFDEFARGGDK